MTSRVRFSAQSPWYDLFSRGARDWLRHNEKVREAVKDQLVDLLAGGDFITQPDQRTVQVPIRLLEHARFRLADAQKQSGAGQGNAKAGDTLRPADAGQDQGGDEGEGGTDEGGFKLLLELKVDDIVDWLTEELELPDLRPKSGATIDELEIVREGTGKRGIRARLDRRRTMKEAVKRRAIQSDPAPFVDDDLRFHQLKQRPRLASNAVVVFALDVSVSMTAIERKLAKTFFFFALSGLRRQYHRVDVRFVAHTTEAWEFPEKEFFEVSGSGGTMASSAFRLVETILEEHYDPSQYNAYVFYASDGENATDDRQAAAAALAALAERLNYLGYLETRPGAARFAQTDMRSLINELSASGARASSQVVSEVRDVWQAIRHFFVHQSKQTEA
jgi:sporulation protein YhbH